MADGSADSPENTGASSITIGGLVLLPTSSFISDANDNEEEDSLQPV